MKKCGFTRRGSALGAAAVALGTMIILALILPSVFWWYMIGAALIVFGVSIITGRL